MEDKIYGRIYGVECLIEHKIYVGQTIRPVWERIREHKRKKSLLGDDIRKYGWENFVWVVLEECTSSKLLDEAEIRWIAKLDCIEPNGYNCNAGGWGGTSPSPSTRAKMSASGKGKHFNDKKGKKDSPETRARKSASQMGNTKGRGNKGKPKTKAHRVNLSNANRYVVYPILNAELMQQQLTYRDLANHLGIARETMAGKLRGKHELFRSEAVAIKEFLQTEIPLEKLFAKVNDDGTIAETADVMHEKRKCIYPNLDAELIRQNLTYNDLVRHLNVPLETIASKLRGRRKLEKKMAIAIREFLQVETPLEVLFAKADGECVLADKLSTKKKRVFYPNLDVELVRNKISYSDLARHLGISIQTVSNKLRGKCKLDEKTALAIREILQVETPLEILFARADEGTSAPPVE